MMIKDLKDRLKKNRWHFIGWTIFIAYEIVVVGSYSGTFGHPITYAGHYLMNILFFYLHARRALPWGLSTKKQTWWRLPMALTLEFLLYIAANYFLDFLLFKGHFVSGPAKTLRDLHYNLKTVYRCLYFMMFATGYYLFVEYVKEKKHTNELEKQQLQDTIERQKMLQEMAKAQNAFLMAQINPHFFFNTLDFLYHLVEFTTPVAAKAVSTLSVMMRFAIDADKVGDYIVVGQEVEQIDNLFYLNQLREKLDIEFVVADEAMSLQIIPLVLLTLAENILKHGNLKDGNKARMRISIDDEYFVVETDNAIGSASFSNGVKTGLTNTFQRLKFAYGNDILFMYGADDIGRFKVRLQLPVLLLKIPVFLNV